MPSRLSSNRAGFSGDLQGFSTIFPTEFGWMGIVGNSEVTWAAFAGHSSPASVKKAVQRLASSDGTSPAIKESDWHPRLREALEAYTFGTVVNFDEFELLLPRQTAFRDQVLAATRRLDYGETTTYGDLARQVGHPGAARAVGTVMSTNRFPIIIPCHRVLAAGGKLGGYTSPAGTDLKQRLLEMEGCACPASCSN